MMMMINVIQVDKNNQSIHFCKHSHRGTQCSCGCEVSFYFVLPVNFAKELGLPATSLAVQVQAQTLIQIQVPQALVGPS